ncbi:MAG: hypothetical protein H6668_19385 [Ardenticatenaceae bacterium]|nr:hypothetical protein [Ardenticatenaceae bacterium]
MSSQEVQQGKQFAVDAKYGQVGVIGNNAKVEGGIHFHGDPHTSLSFPIVQLPPHNPHFTGREVLLARLAAGTRVAIAGMGGVGKTQLALAYAHQRREQFELIAWLNGSEAAVLDGELRRLGVLLRLPLPVNDALAARQMVLSWLNGTDKRWLLVYDNVDSLSAAELRPFLPTAASHSGCQLLLTSRSPHWGSVAQVVDVNVFTPEEAVAFLAQRLGADAPGLAELAAELGYLPLALAQAAAYMETRGVKALTEHPDTAQSPQQSGLPPASDGGIGESATVLRTRPGHPRKSTLPHPDTAQLNNLGALDSMGIWRKARLYPERALASEKKLLYLEHPDTATSLNNLAWLLYDEGDLAEAARLMRCVVVILEKTIPNHSNTQTARQSLAAIEAALRRGG